MIKYAVKRPSASNPKIIEWITVVPVEGNTFVSIQYYDTKEEADQAAAEWGGAATTVEINRPD